MRHRLFGFGLRMGSDLPLPGATLDPETLPPDVVINVEFDRQNVVRCSEHGTGNGATESGPSLGPYRLTPEHLIFTQSGVAAYRIRRDGSGITIHPEPSAPESELADYLQATALPALLWARETPVLHASAAVLPGADTAIAFVGRSGAGKSTLLQTLLGIGARAVADDALTLRGTVVSGLAGCTYVAGDPRLVLPIPPARQLAAARLGCVVELAETGPHHPERQNPRRAVAVLLHHLHRVRAARLLGFEPQLLPRLAELATIAPVYRWDQACAARANAEELRSLLGQLSAFAPRAETPR